MSLIKNGQFWLPSLLNEFLTPECRSKNCYTPSINILECELCYKVELTTPGMTKEDFNIEVIEDNQLIVTLEKKCSKDCTNDADCKCNDSSNEAAVNDDRESAPCDCTGDNAYNEKENKYLRRGFDFSSYNQTLILPDNVDKDLITAKQENGILTIRIPKKESFVESRKTKSIVVE